MVYFSRVVSNHENGKFAFGLLSTNRIITIILWKWKVRWERVSNSVNRKVRFNFNYRTDYKCIIRNILFKIR